LEEAAAIVEGKVTPRLASLLDGVKEEKKVSLAVIDTKLGGYIRAGVILCIVLTRM
jgi:nucleolar protein 58